MITTDEKKIIKEALQWNGWGGVMTFLDPDGNMSTNYVPFRKHFDSHTWTIEHQKYCLELWESQK